MYSIVQYIIWANYNDLTVLPHWNHVFFFFTGIIPKMAQHFTGSEIKMAAQHFRSMNYDNLPRSSGAPIFTIKNNHWLVVWNMNFMIFHSVGNVIIPTDELHHFSEG